MERDEAQGLVHTPVPKIGETENYEEQREDDSTRVVPLCEVPYSNAKGIDNGEEEGNVQNLAGEGAKEDEETKCESESEGRCYQHEVDCMPRKRVSQGDGKTGPERTN